MHTNPSINVASSIGSLVSSSSPTEIYDVVVVGAGPVGLATAIGLRQRGIENILVIDQTRAFRQVGQVVDLLPNGLKALKYIDFTAYNQVKKKGMKISNPTQSNDQETAGKTQEPQPPKTSPEWAYKNLKGQKLLSFPLKYDDWLNLYGEGRVSIGWYDLQTTLRHLLPDDRVKANHRCINVVNEPDTGCVRVDCVSDLGAENNPYAHWTNGQQDVQSQDSETISQQWGNKSIRARLVVAADGINSMVRRVLYTDTSYHAFARPEYSGFAAVGCLRITKVPNELLTELQEKFFENSPIVTILNDELFSQPVCREDPNMMLIQRLDGSLGYLMHLALPLEELKEPGNELINLALQQLEKAGFPNVFKQLVSLSPPANLLHRPYYIHRATLSDSLPFPSTAHLNAEPDSGNNQLAWSAGRIVLVGDAAHGMPPFMAQGANQGFEDALAVVTLIANIQDKQDWDDTQVIATIFEKYERLRRPFMVCIQKATLKRINLVKQEREEYEQQVYHRDFDQVLEALR